MKAQTKALVASLIIVALGLSAVSGVTYSWWSDSEQATIEVTTGKIELEVSLGGADLNDNADGSIPNPMMPNEISGTGTKTFVYSGWIASAGDVLTIPINSIKITSNIETQFTESFSIISNNGEDLSNHVQITPSSKVGETFSPSQTAEEGGHDIFETGDLKEIRIKILDSMPQGKTFTITIQFAAYQKSATDVPSGTQGTTTSAIIVADGEKVAANVVSGGAPVSSASISFDGTNVNAGEYVVSSVTSSDVASKGYTITDGEVLGGISVENVASTGSKLNNTLVKVVFVVDRVIDSDNIEIRHNGVAFPIGWQSSAEGAIASGQGFCFNDGFKTTVTFYTDEGFSMYYAVDKSVTLIGTADELFAFAQDVNDKKNTYNGKTVKLIADIDLGNKPWTPIGGLDTKNCFQGTFDGNSKTIRNLNVDADVIQMDNEAGVGLFGYIDHAHGTAVIKNLTVDGAVIKGHHNVGVIAGAFAGVMTNCRVMNAELFNTHYNPNDVNDPASCGDKTGAICGYVQALTEQEGTIKNCYAKNCTIVGSRDAGALFGADTTGAVDKSSCTNVSNSVSFYDSGCSHGDANKNISNGIIGRTA